MPHHADPLAPAEAIVSGSMALLARRYAGALYGLADERRAIDAVASDLRGLARQMRENADFRALAHNPRLPRTVLMKIAKEIASSAGLDPLTANFIGLLAQNRRLILLPVITRQFLDTLSSRRGEFTADVRAARPLNQKQEEELAGALHALAGGRVNLAVREDKSLLGGLVVRMGSRLIDASVKGRIDRLERQLKLQSFNRQKGAA